MAGMDEREDKFDHSMSQLKAEIHALHVDAAAMPPKKTPGARPQPRANRQPKMTVTDQRRYHELSKLTREMMVDFHWPEFVKAILPSEWKDISTHPIPDKTRITLRVDVDVAKFYRKLGPGYQARMNEVLRAFMLARLVEILGIGPEKPELLVGRTEIEQLMLDREVALMQELEGLRRKRTGG